MEIDETVVVRRKYERGRVASKAQVRLFGEKHKWRTMFLGSNRWPTQRTKSFTNDTEIHSSRVHHLFRSLAFL